MHLSIRLFRRLGAQQKKTVNLDALTTSQILMGNGTFATYDQTSEHTTCPLGANYQFDKRSGLFARYTSAARMPSLGNYITSATAKPIIQPLDLGKAGYKFRSRPFNGSTTPMGYCVGIRHLDSHAGLMVSAFTTVGGKQGIIW